MHVHTLSTSNFLWQIIDYIYESGPVALVRLWLYHGREEACEEADGEAEEEGCHGEELWV